MLMLSADYIMAASRTRPPDFIVKRTKVDGSGGEYLRRWWVIPRNDSFNIYLHQFVDDDDDRALHDHPWPSASLILQGGYIEHLPGGITQLRVPGELIYREPEASHRISLHRDTQGNPLPAWSLFMTGARTATGASTAPKAGSIGRNSPRSMTAALSEKDAAHERGF